MIKKKYANAARLRRHRRVRKKVTGTAARPRLSVFRSANQIYAQIVDDERRVTLVAASSRDAELGQLARNEDSSQGAGAATDSGASETQNQSRGKAARAAAAAEGEAVAQSEASSEAPSKGGAKGKGAAKSGAPSPPAASEGRAREEGPRDALAGIAANRRVVQARLVGRLIAQRARQRGIERVVFDRGGYLYHGRVAALATGAREGGLDF